MLTKIKIVFIPFFLISIGIITGYNFLRWVFDIKLHVVHLKDDLINYWLPVGLSLLGAVVGLRKRVRILDVKGKRDNGYFFYQFVASFAIAIPLIISQTYLETASYNLISADNVTSIDKSKPEKYIAINDFTVDVNNTASYETARQSGRHNENLIFYMYFATPIKDLKCISQPLCPVFWYATQYFHSISNNVPGSTKQAEFEKFIKASTEEYKNYNFHSVRYFENIPYSDNRDGYLEAIKKRQIIPSNQELFILTPKKERFEERTGNSLYWAFGSFGIGAFIFLLMTIIPSINSVELHRQQENKPLREDELKFILQFLIPRGNHVITAILIDLNIIIFMVTLLSGLNIVSPTAKELLEWGGNRRHEVLTGQYWRLFSSMFLHAGLMHLFLNMFGLGLASGILEPVLGKSKLLIGYIFTGIVASFASIYWHENTVSVGASGAIFGLYGIIAALLIKKVFPEGVSGACFLLITIQGGLSLLMGLAGGVDNAAHIGGLIMGFIFGFLLCFFLDKGIWHQGR